MKAFYHTPRYIVVSTVISRQISTPGRPKDTLELGERSARFLCGLAIVGVDLPLVVRTHRRVRASKDLMNQETLKAIGWSEIEAPRRYPA